jgi:group I intron endonuclease
MTPGIYAIINSINGKMYIGSSINIDKRWYKHRTELRRNEHHSGHLQRAWNKYKEENFYFITLLECKDSELHIIEQKVMDSLKPEYNVLPAAYSPKGYKHPKEFGNEISERLKGHEVSKETREKIGNANRGHRHSKETLEKISLASIGRRKPFKVFNGFISPDGVVYKNIFDLRKFSEEHNLNHRDLYHLAGGFQKSHRGWKRINERSD